MSQRNVEILLGKILTDEDFRRSFFPIQAASFEVAAAHGLELTPTEQSALCCLRRRRFEFIAHTLDPRISRSRAPSGETAEHAASAAAGPERGNRGVS